MSDADPNTELVELKCETPDLGETRKASSWPWISSLAVAICVANFVGLVVANDFESWDTLARFGYAPVETIRRGANWPLLTSVFVHFNFWHIAFNVYWLWRLGSRLERAIGSRLFLGFFLASALVSSSFQLSFSDTTGIGASGVIYAIFGFMWPARQQYPDFQQALTPKIIQSFVVWMIGCVVVTYLQIMDIGNAAHISGFLFGGAVARYFIERDKSRLMLCAIVTLIVCSVVPLYWSPWSASWLAESAYRAHAAGDYNLALLRYSRLIDVAPDNSWAYRNRSEVYEALGEVENAAADLSRAQELDPNGEPDK